MLKENLCTTPEQADEVDLGKWGDSSIGKITLEGIYVKDQIRIGQNSHRHIEVLQCELCLGCCSLPISGSEINKRAIKALRKHDLADYKGHMLYLTLYVTRNAHLKMAVNTPFFVKA
jgi:hypothetical protein